MSGSGTLQPKSGLRYHTDADSPLPETINPIIDAVESVASKKHITESGSNDNGKYIKFDDGTIICHKKRAPAPYLSDIACQCVWVFPAGFMSVDDIAVNATTNPASVNNFTPGRQDIMPPIVTTMSISSVTFYLYTKETHFVEGDLLNLDLIAIGRWK